MFALIIVLLVISLIAFAISFGLTSDGKIGARVVSGIFAILFVLFLVIGSVATVGTQDIGVKTSFGKVTGEGITAGWHWKAPWEKIHTLDAKQQTDTYASNSFDGSDQNNAQGGCIHVRIARQATACVNLSIRWQNKADGVGYLFQNFKTDDNIRTQLLHRDLQAATNNVFADYDPLGLNANGDSTQPSVIQLGNDVKTALTQQVGQYLTIENVYIPIFFFDTSTQQRLNQLQLQVAQTRIAIQQKQTNRAQAKANSILSKSLNQAGTGVLTSKCLDILKDAVDNGQALPAGFSCFGGTNTSVAVK